MHEVFGDKVISLGVIVKKYTITFLETGTSKENNCLQVLGLWYKEKVRIRAKSLVCAIMDSRNNNKNSISNLLTSWNVKM